MRTGSVGRRFGFGLRLEGVERIGPELVEELAQRTQRISLHGIHPTRAVSPVDDESRVLEHAQMLGDGRPAHGKVPSQLAHRQWPIPEPDENGAARAVSEGVELDVLVSNH